VFKRLPGPSIYLDTVGVTGSNPVSRTSRSAWAIYEEPTLVKPSTNQRSPDHERWFSLFTFVSGKIGPTLFTSSKERVITFVITHTLLIQSKHSERKKEMHTLTVTSVGNSLGVVLPKDVTSSMELQKGDKIFLTKAPDGYRLTPYDPEFKEQMETARKVMKKRRNVLRQLSK
jgi:putative addiction module antidote